MHNSLAIFGGEKTRISPMPFREAFGEQEVSKINEVIQHYQSHREDPPYNGVFEKKFCEMFADYHGGGYADAVASGTAAIYIALAALQLPAGSEVVISPVTDSGPLNAIIMLGLVPVVADSSALSFNSKAENFSDKITSKTSALLVVHCGGEPLDMVSIMALASEKGLKVLEDCSQATGASIEGEKVGTFGDIAAFSTMYRKNLTAGASSGVVFTKNFDLYQLALAYADRGKQILRTDINQNDPGHALFPALNFNTDEISCAIGMASLGRLDETIKGRLAFLCELRDVWSKEGIEIATLYEFDDGYSPFFQPVILDLSRLTCSKIEFANAVLSEGIPVNTHYGCLITDWEWATPYLSNDSKTPNAKYMKENSFNLFLNEKYTTVEAKDIAIAIRKVELFFAK